MKSHAVAAALRAQLSSPPVGDYPIEGITADARSIPLSYRHHVRGFHPVRPDLPAVAFESLLESRAIDWFSRRPELMRLSTQPITVRYRIGRSVRRYTPDLRVRLAHVSPALRQLGFGLDTLVEVKPIWMALRDAEKLACKFGVLRAACNLPVVLLTDRDLDELEEVFHVA